MTVTATQMHNLVQPVNRQDVEPPVLVVDCPECWFPRGAPAASEAVASTVADAHDRAAHRGRPTAVIRAPFEESVADGSDPVR